MYHVIERQFDSNTTVILAGPFATQKEAEAARRIYCLEVHGPESYRRQTCTWISSPNPIAPPVA